MPSDAPQQKQFSDMTGLTVLRSCLCNASANVRRCCLRLMVSYELLACSRDARQQQPAWSPGQTPCCLRQLARQLRAGSGGIPASEMIAVSITCRSLSMIRRSAQRRLCAATRPPPACCPHGTPLSARPAEPLRVGQGPGSATRALRSTVSSAVVYRINNAGGAGSVRAVVSVWYANLSAYRTMLRLGEAERNPRYRCLQRRRRNQRRKQVGALRWAPTVTPHMMKGVATRPRACCNAVVCIQTRAEKAPMTSPRRPTRSRTSSICAASKS